MRRPPRHLWLRSRYARAWALWMLRRRAVVLDTETTDLDGRVCELAVVDARTGRVLLDTLIDPGRPIAPAATAVHGISDLDVAGSPSLAEVLPRLRAVVGRRPVLAYNAPYDLAVLRESAVAAGLHLGRLGLRWHWGCIMRARSAADGSAWRKLEGGHRAVGDAVAAAVVLHHLAGRELRTPERYSA